MLTQHDLDQIGNLITSSENRIIQKVEVMINERLDRVVDQIQEYININIEAHETWLQNHEKRITKLEDSSYLIRDRKKG